MGFPVFAAIVVVSLAIAIAVQLLEKKMGWDWLIIAVPAIFGAYFASETFPGSTTFQAIKSEDAAQNGQGKTRRQILDLYDDYAAKINAV